VKRTADLLAVRSDAYRVTGDHRLVLEERRRGRPPLVELDPEVYRLLGQFEVMFGEGVPSLVDCERLTVEGPVRFAAGVVCRGQVRLKNGSGVEVTLPAGTYADEGRGW
jgi:hypothetical protein